MTQVLRQALEAPPGATAPLIVVGVAPGVGKSHITAQLLSRRRVLWFGERWDMREQLEGFVHTPLPGVAPLPGDGDEVVQGCVRRDGASCRAYEARVRPVEDQGLGRFTQALACRPCPHLVSCDYQRWTPGTSWLFAPHRRLALSGQGKLWQGRDVVVVDESPLRDLLLGTHLDLEAVSRIASKLPEGSKDCAGQALSELLATCRDLLHSPPAQRHRVELRRLLSDLGYEFVMPQLGFDGAEAALSGNAEPDQRPEMHGHPEGARGVPLQQVDFFALRRLLGRAGQLTAFERQQLIALFEALAEDVQARPTCVLKMGGTDQACGIAAGRAVLPEIPAHLPVVTLDFTARVGLLTRLFPGRPVVEVAVGTTEPELRPRQTAPVYQVVDRRFGRLPDATLSDRKGKVLAECLEVVDRYRADHPEQRGGLIIKYGLMGRAHVSERVLRSFDTEDIGYFWRQRGTNDFSFHDALFVLGAPELHALRTEAICRAFMSLVEPQADEGPFAYDLVPTRGSSEHYARLPGESGIKLADRGYARGLQDLVYWDLHQGEYTQAICRLRPFSETTKEKVAYFFSAVALDLLELDFVFREELLGEVDLLQRCIDHLVSLRHSGHRERVLQRDIAAALGVSSSAISQAKGRVANLARARKLEALCNAVPSDK